LSEKLRISPKCPACGEQSLVLEAEDKETVDVYCENCGFKERAKG
jgi:predicted RNA-binding Zn-ribbon protein involved in translation (DUF1610 family)